LFRNGKRSDRAVRASNLLESISSVRKLHRHRPVQLKALKSRPIEQDVLAELSFLGKVDQNQEKPVLVGSLSTAVANNTKDSARASAPASADKTELVSRLCALSDRLRSITNYHTN
jgi:hypothetical protein